MVLLLNDVGHGRNTYPPSKGVPGLPEHTFNAAVGKETKRLLAGKVPTYEAQEFGGLDVGLSARTRAYDSKFAADGSAIGISHHANAGAPNAKGFGVFYWHTSTKGKKIAELLLAEYKKEFPGLPIWGSGLFPSVPGTWTNFHMCREPRVPFVLIEWGFMTNSEDFKRLTSDDYRKRCALVTARAVCRYYGISFQEQTQAAATTETPGTFRIYTGSFGEGAEGYAGALEGASKIRQLGYYAFVKDNDTRVWTGPFGTLEQARIGQAKISDEFGFNPKIRDMNTGKDVI